MKYVSLALVLLSTSVVAVEPHGKFISGTLGFGRYQSDWGDPEITTPNMLGNVSAKIGYTFDNNVDLYAEVEHWSSMQGFPHVFNSPDEDGNGFNAIWLKVEKRFYFTR